MKKLFRNKLLIFAFALGCFAIAYVVSLNTISDFSGTAKEFETTLHEKESYSKTELNELANKTKEKSYAEIYREREGFYPRSRGYVFVKIKM